LASLQQLVSEAYRLRLLSAVDERLRLAGYERVAGVDEAGRGCLAGPVVAAAVVLRPGHSLPGVDDSKNLSARVRERLAAAIKESALTWSVKSVSPTVIDRTNILDATRRAMLECLEDLHPRPDCAIVDAVRLSSLDFPCLGLVRADAVSYSVASASILAKVERDRQMRELDREYPQYGFAKHKGYGAAEHREALATYGPSPVHRLTFRSVLPRTDEAGA
jgi:ribonuclease HII